MSKKCKAFSKSKLGLEPPDNRKAFYAGWDAALRAAPERRATREGDMNNLREAAQQVLEALEWHLDRGTWGADLEGCAANLRAALEQDEPEGVVCARCGALAFDPLVPQQAEPVVWDGRCVLGHCNSPAGCENNGECRAATTQPAGG